VSTANDAAYRYAAIISESIKQTAICNAMADYLTIANDTPALTKMAASENQPESVVNEVVATTMMARDNAIRKAEAEHYERLAAAGRHYGISNGTERHNPDATHAQSWLQALTQGH
jgi:hypothetical protein